MIDDFNGVGDILKGIPRPKKGNTQEYSNYHTIVLMSHTSKVILKILQARLK